MLRIVFSKKSINNRHQRDFLENSKKTNIIKFRDFYSKIIFTYQEVGLFF